ncbi:MAG: hypothetical protein HY961_00725 [Ignavibacteriae bacterium]|nr:hypothetical protein [Ignavibacteriota bacterium]
MTLEAVAQRITQGERLILAADEELLARLPHGSWIGGSIPYFMADDGGTCTKDMIFVDEVPSVATRVSIRSYDEQALPAIAADEFDDGYTMLIIPAFSGVHTSFAKNSPQYKDIFLRPLVGWISGLHLADLGRVTPKVFNGQTGQRSDAHAVAMHIELPPSKVANLDIVNLFTQSAGDVITFDTTGFSASDCFVNGEKTSFAAYLNEKKVNTQLPLVADYCGAMINTSFQSVDAEKNVVAFYAPVFKGIEYKIAAPVSDYVQEFKSKVDTLHVAPVFTCNCILNYLYSELEGKKTSHITGPITFGEIAYQLLNQTMVYLTVEDAA